MHVDISKFTTVLLLPFTNKALQYKMCQLCTNENRSVFEDSNTVLTLRGEIIANGTRHSSSTVLTNLVIFAYTAFRHRI